MLESGGEKTQPVPQKQRKNACMAVLLLTIVIAVGGCVGEMGFDGIIGGGHMINNAYAEESVLLVTNETAKLLAGDGEADDEFGNSVSVYNNTAVIGAYYDDDNGSKSGSVYVFEYSSGNWTQKEKLLASDGEADDEFGYSVSVYNNTAVIGAYLDDDNGSNSGSAYVFEKNSTGHWTQKENLLASDGEAGDLFGHSVSVYNNTAVIGAYLDDDNGSNSGSAYVFEKNSTGHWTQKEKLLASDGEAGDRFGNSVSVYNNTAVIGAYRDDNGIRSGSAYVFEKNSTGHWTQKEKLLASDGEAGDEFGYSVSVYNNTAVIGAYLDDDYIINSGSAYVFEKNSTGHWTQKEKLLASDGYAYDNFGHSVSVYNNTAVIGAYYDDVNGSKSGSAYVLEKNSTGHWTQKEKLLASDGAIYDRFGYSVSVYNNTAVIGAYLDDDNGSNSGSAYVFTILQVPTANAGADQVVDEGDYVTLDGTGSTDPNGDTITYLWSQTRGPTVTLSSSTSESPMFGAPLINYDQILTFSLTVNDGTVDSTPDTVDIEVSNVNVEESVLLGTNEIAKLLASDGEAGDRFGNSVSVYNNTAVIGAYYDDDNGSNSGSAYVFEKNSTGHWTQKENLLASDGEASDWFGHSVSVYNNTAVIGASGDNGSGSAYVFEKNSTGHWTQKENLLASDGEADDEFGWSVSVYNNTAVIGASGDNGSGSAYVFEKNSTGHWTQKENLLASDGEADDEFGNSVSVYNNTAVIGAYYDDDNGSNSGSAYVFEKNSTGHWTQKENLLASDGEADDEFGNSVSVYNNTAVIGAYYDDDNGYESGSAYVFEKNSTGHWTQKEKLLASDGEADDRFGYSVSVYNNTAVIGAYLDDDNGSNSGSAYVFEKNSTGHWTQKEKLLASDATRDDLFGYSVSVYNNTAVTGVYLDDDNGSNSGSAYVFTIFQAPTANAGADQVVDEGDYVTLDGTGSTDPNGDTITYLWSQTRGPTVTLSSSTSESPMFGVPLINYDQILTFSLTVNDGTVDSTPDTVHIEVSNANVEESVLLVTNEIAKLLASDGEAGDEFGYSVSVYNNTAVIGAFYDDDNGYESGSAYVFEKNSTGHWTQKEKLLASDGARDDRFGHSVSVYNNTAVIGAYLDGPNSGSAYVFEKNSTGHWTQKEKLLASDGARDDWFGYSVSVYNNTAVIGASGDNDNSYKSGSAYVFEKNSTGHWTQKEKLLASDGAIYDWFGHSVSVYNNTAVIGALFDDDNGLESGFAYVFEKNSTGHWTQKEKLLASDGARDDRFGHSVSVYNNTAVIGAYRDDDNGLESGSAYVFEKNSTGHWTQKEKLLASDGAIYDWFGHSVSVYNNTAVIGAYLDGPNSGSAYVFEKNSTGHWTQKEKLLASDGARDDWFGYSVSVYNNTAVIGAYRDDDNGSNSGSAYVFTILQAPTANAGADQVVDEGDYVTLDGTGSADPNGDTITYAWSQTRGPTVTLSSSTSASPTFDAPLINSNQAILTFSLTVNDGTVDSTPDTVDITVSNVNTPPTANAGADQTVSEGGITVTLDGTGSADPNGDTITYAWSQNEDNAFEVDLSSSTSVSPMFTTPTVNSEQTLTFSLVVNDRTVDSTPDTVDITIQNTINESPTANAGADQTVSEGDNVTLDGTGSADPNGDAITYLWSQTRGPTVTLSSSTSVSPMFTTPTVNSEQTLTFSLVVNDRTVDSTPDTVDITIQNTINESPTANAGADQTVSEGDNVTLDGTGSADPNGDAITYLWSQNEDNAFEVDLSSSTSVSPMFTTPTVNSEQTLTFSLVVNDRTVDSTPDTVDITIQNTINESPTANAGADQTVSEGDNVTLDGTGSADPNGDAITYLWSQNEDNAFEVDLSSSTSVSPMFTTPTVNSEQTLTFSLVVNDRTVDSTPDTVDITIQNTINESPTANAGADQTVSEGDNVTLDGTGSADPNGDAITYLWSQNEDNAFEVDLSSSTSVSPMFTTPTVNSEQTLTFSLVVNDRTVDSTPDTVDITIQNTINESPTANAGADQTVSEGDNVTLDGTGSADPNGDAITYLWSQTRGPTVTLSSSTSVSPMFTTPTVNSEQTLTFSLVVNDRTVDSTPDTVDITIQNTINESPTANAGADQTVSEGDNVTLDGTGSADPNGDAITYLWSQTRGPTVTLSSSTSVSPMFTTPTVNSEQTLTFSLVVNDRTVDSTPDTVDITIQNTINESPTANAGADQTVSEGDNVTLDGTGSADPNGDAITYLWSQNEDNAFEVDLSSSTSVSPMFTTPTVNSEQTLTFSLVVNDRTVDSTPDTVDITIQNTINESPTANAGADQTVSEGDNVTLDGTGSADPNGDAITYLWSQNEDNAFEVDLSSSTSVSPMFTTPTVNSEQTLTFSLVVNDRTVDSTPDTVDITIQNTINESPTANAGADQTVSEGDNVTLDGTGSADPNGDAITYLWSQNEDNAFEVDLSSSTSVSPMFTTPTVNSEQTLTFSLVVNDRTVDSTPDTVDITIQNTINESPTANAGADQTVSEGDNVTLDGTGSADPNGDAITYLWSQNEDNAFEVDLSSSTSVSPMFTTPTVNSEQTLTFSLVVNDRTVDSTPDTVDITIQNTINESPTANAGADQTVSEGDNVTLDGTGSADPNGDAITYLWSQTRGPTVTLSSSTSVSPMFTTPTVNSEQTLTFSLVVNDRTVDSTPDTVDITIQNTINESPTANAGADQTVSEGDNVTLDGTGSADPNGDAITYLWSQTRGPTVTLSSSTSVSPMFTTPTVNSEQTLTFSLVVNDRTVDSTPDTVDITIQNTINESPTANAGADQTVSEGDNVTLDGTGSADPNGDAITYLWSQNEDNAFEVDLSSSTSVSPMFTTPTVNSEQTLTFSLVVNDRTVDSTPDTVDITIQNTINESPTANAGADQTVSEGDNVTLDGTGSADPNGDAITYLWSQNEDNAFEVDLSSSTSVSPMFTTPTVNSEQTLTFSLVVNDRTVDSTPDTVDITIQNTINESPTANAGADQTVSEGDNVTLDGTGSADPNGDAITYLWSQNEDNAFEVDLSSSTSVSPMFTTPTVNSEQTLTFSLVVNDRTVDSTPDTVDITIQNTINESPTANAGADQTVSEGGITVTLDGTGSADPNGDAITYLWSQTRGPTVTLSSSTSVSPMFTTPTVNSEQTLTFSLVVNDRTVDSTPDTVDITIQNTINESPTANAGADQTVSEGDNVTLDGTGSADPNGDAITYLWSQNEDNAFEVDLSSSTSVSPMFTTPTVNSEQTLTFSLVVNDRTVDSTSDTVDITIQNTINESPTANAGADQTVSEGGITVTLDGTGSADPNGDAITYLWSQTRGPTVTLSSSTSVSPMFTTPTVNSEQTLTFSLVVNDRTVDSTPDTVDITVSNVNTPPTANAGADQTVSEGDNVTLDGTGSADPNGDAITYLWSQNEDNAFEVDLSSSTSVSPMFTTPTVNSEQTLTFSLVVNDRTVDSTSDTVDITIQNTINESPTANAGADQTVSEGGITVTLDGTGSADPNGDAITYLWSQTRGPTVTLSSSTSVSPMFTTPTVNSEQTLTFSLVVNDRTVDSTPDTVDITVSNVNTPPTANAGADQTVSEGDNVTLDGTGSADPNGDAITYLWSQNEDNAFEVDLSSSTSASPTFDAPLINSNQAILTFSLTVNDGTEDSTPDTVDITVLDTDDVLLTSSGSPLGSSGGGGSGSSSGIGTSGGGGGSGSSSGIGTSGGGGGSGSSSGIGTSGGGGGSSTWVDDIYLKSVSWDCNAGTIKIIAGPDSDYISVAVRTTQLGIHRASITGDDIPGYRAFVSPMHKTEDYINIKVAALSGRNLVTISESISVDACVGERTYHAPDDSTTTTIKQPVPKQEDDKDRLADFVDPKKNPQYYIDRYNNEIEYREWFDENYPGITIYKAVGLPVPDPTLEPAVEQKPAVEQEPAMKQEPEPICDPGAELVDGFCIPVTPRPEENGGGCLIATAAYGTELAPQVQLLREIRDNTVLQTQSGSAFMDSFNSFYYSFSPSIADLERQNPVFREAVKMAVTPLISSLAILDYVDIDSESEMLGYGIGIVAMNIAMYVALPVSALYYVRRLVA